MTGGVPLRLRALIGLTEVLKTVTPTLEGGSGINDLSDFQAPVLDASGTPTGSFFTQQRVFRGRDIFGDDDPETMVSILENPHTEPSAHESPRGSAVNVGPWQLLIQGFTKDDPVNPTDPAHYLMADVKLALANARTRIQSSGGFPSGRQSNLLGCGPAIDDIMIGTGVVRPADQVSAKAYFWLILTLNIAEDNGNPFA